MSGATLAKVLRNGSILSRLLFERRVLSTMPSMVDVPTGAAYDRSLLLVALSSSTNPENERERN
jgi:hypothetical protein